MAAVEIRRIRPEDAGAALEVIATIAAEGRYIPRSGGLWLLPEWRGQGIGAQMMLRVEEWAREVGVQRLALEVFTENERAKRLYQRLGYEVEGLHKGAAKQGEQFVDEYSMAKWLRSPSV